MKLSHRTGFSNLSCDLISHFYIIFSVTGQNLEILLEVIIYFIYIKIIIILFCKLNYVFLKTVLAKFYIYKLNLFPDYNVIKWFNKILTSA